MSGFMRRLRGLFGPRRSPAKAPLPAATHLPAEEWTPEDARVVERETRADDPWALPPLPDPRPAPSASDQPEVGPLQNLPAPGNQALPAPSPPSASAPPDVPAVPASSPGIPFDTGWETPARPGGQAEPGGAADRFDTSAMEAPPPGLPPPAGETPPCPAAIDHIDPSALSPGPGVGPMDLDTGWEVPGSVASGISPAESPELPGNAAPHADPAFGIDLPDYDPDLSQRLGSEEWSADTPSESGARERAAQIVALLEVTSRRELMTALGWLEDFFARHPAPSTFRAIERAALDGLDLPTLQAMDALREVWEQRPEWWVCRILRPRVSERVTSTTRIARGELALSWAVARRVCLARAHLPPADMIDADWLAEWLVLPRAPGSPISFVQYIDEKVADEATEQLYAGLQGRARRDDPTEIFDCIGWQRNILDPGDGLPLSLRMIDLTERRVRSDGTSGDRKDQTDD